MKGNSLDKMLGSFCKIVTLEPGEEKVNVTAGFIKDIDHESGFITIESHQGLGMVNLKSVIAIKPKKRLES